MPRKRSNIKIKVFAFIVLLIFTGCNPLPKAEKSFSRESLFSSELLGISFRYNTDEFPEVIQDISSEFPVILQGDGYSLGIKKIGGIGDLVAKEPDKNFYQFFSGEILYEFRDKNNMKLAEQETIEEFTAKSRKGAIQFMHFVMPEEQVYRPKFIPPELKEVYLYYFHFIYQSDYWYFAIISEKKVDRALINRVIKLIDEASFTQPQNEN